MLILYAHSANDAGSCIISDNPLSCHLLLGQFFKTSLKNESREGSLLKHLHRHDFFIALCNPMEPVRLFQKFIFHYGSSLLLHK